MENILTMHQQLQQNSQQNMIQNSYHQNTISNNSIQRNTISQNSLQLNSMTHNSLNSMQNPHQQLPFRNTSLQQQQPHSSNFYSFHARYQCIKKIGSGSFGTVFLAVDLLSNEKVAVKFEPKNTNFPQLNREGRLLKILAGDQTHPNGDPVNVGIPRLRFLGETNNHRCLVQELLGESLESLFQSQNRFFTLKTILLLADQIISRIEFVHSKGYLHRDVKPENFLMGLPGSKYALCLYIIDFGLSKRYRHEITREHIPYKTNKSLTGTARYASINNHMGYEQSRRDDLEAVGYMLVYFLRRGKLPWSGLPGGNKEEKYRNIMNKKSQTSLSELLHGFPSEFSDYLVYTRSLGFTDIPSYNNLRSLFRRLFTNCNFTMDFAYDWCISQDHSAPQKRNQFCTNLNTHSTIPSSLQISHPQ